MRIAVYPGSFDPITNGHLDIIKRASTIFDKVIVGILTNSKKDPDFDIPERMELIKKTTLSLSNVSVTPFSGLLVNFAKENEAKVIIKGLRALSDFEYEFQMALVNATLSDEIETLFMMTNNKYSFVSSSIVKEIAKLSGDISALVPQEIIDDILNKYKF